MSGNDSEKEVYFSFNPTNLANLSSLSFIFFEREDLKLIYFINFDTQSIPKMNYMFKN